MQITKEDLETIKRPEVRNLFEILLTMPDDIYDFAVWACIKILRHEMSIEEAKALYHQTGGKIPDGASITA